MLRELGFGPWIMGLLMVGLALLGLFMARGAVDSLFHAVGLLTFLFAVLFIFGLIQRNTPSGG